MGSESTTWSKVTLHGKTPLIVWTKILKERSLTVSIIIVWECTLTELENSRHYPLKVTDPNKELKGKWMHMHEPASPCRPNNQAAIHGSRHHGDIIKMPGWENKTIIPWSRYVKQVIKSIWSVAVIGAIQERVLTKSHVTAWWYTNEKVIINANAFTLQCNRWATYMIL